VWKGGETIGPGSSSQFNATGARFQGVRQDQTVGKPGRDRRQTNGRSAVLEQSRRSRPPLRWTFQQRGTFKRAGDRRTKTFEAQVICRPKGAGHHGTVMPSSRAEGRGPGMAGYLAPGCRHLYSPFSNGKIEAGHFAYGKRWVFEGIRDLPRLHEEMEWRGLTTGQFLFGLQSIGREVLQTGSIPRAGCLPRQRPASASPVFTDNGSSLPDTSRKFKIALAQARWQRLSGSVAARGCHPGLLGNGRGEFLSLRRHAR